MRKWLMVFLLLSRIHIYGQEAQNSIEPPAPDITVTQEYSGEGRPLKSGRLKSSTDPVGKTFDKNAYAKATKDLNYKETPKVKKKEKKNSPKIYEPRKISFMGLGQVLLIIGLVVGLLVIIYLIVKHGPKSNPSVKDGEDWLTEVMETEDAPSDVFEIRLRDATRNGEYGLAIRLLYLQVLFELHQKKIIHWKKDKTDADYISELRGTVWFEEFRNLTRIYEYCWFSETVPSLKTFEEVQPLYISFRQQLSTSSLKPA